MRLLWVGIALILLLPASVHAQEKTTVTPETTRLSVKPGETIRTPIEISNPSNTYIEVRAVIKNSCPTSETFGTPIEQLPSGYGLKDWHTDANINKILTIPAQQSISYQATLQVPSGAAEQSYFGCLWIESTTDRSTALGHSLIVLTVGQPNTRLTVQSLSYNEQPTEATFRYGSFVAKISNTGKATADVNAVLKITDNSGALVSELEPVATKSVLPKHSNYLIFTPTEKLPNGQLTATLGVEDQQGSTADKSLQFALVDPAPQPALSNRSQPDATTLGDWLALAAVVSIIVGAIIAEIHFSHPHPAKKKVKNSRSR